VKQTLPSVREIDMQESNNAYFCNDIKSISAVMRHKPFLLFCLSWLIACILLASCATQRYGQRKRKKKDCDCPKWSIVNEQACYYYRALCYNKNTFNVAPVLLTQFPESPLPDDAKRNH